MKANLILAGIILGSVFTHTLPALSIIMIATGGEVTRALGAALCLSSCLALGYFHGWNRTF